MTKKGYLLSVPERVVRAIVGLGAGVTRELGEVTLPPAVRRGQLYQNLVDATLRFLIEEVGGARPAGADAALPDNFLARRAVGNAVELLGIVAFRASPVWILAALADASGLGRTLIPEIADELEAQGLLEPGTTFTGLDDLLDGLERTSARIASTINTPPLDVAALRADLAAIRQQTRAMHGANLPSREAIARLWTDLREESSRQNQSVFMTSSAMAMSAARAFPVNVRWFAASLKAGARRTGQVWGTVLLDHYRRTLDDMRAEGSLAYSRKQLQPYLSASAAQFSPSQPTLTGRMLHRIQQRKKRTPVNP